MIKLIEFLEKIHEDTYPEPASSVHEGVMSQIIPMIAPKIPEGGKILDVGCGQGGAMRRFEELGFDVTGTSLNREDFAFLQSKFPGQVHFHEQNDLPDHWSGRFDLVWARHVIEHSIMPYFTLSEFSRLLKPDCLLYIEVPSPDTACHHESNKNHYSVLGKQMWLHLITRSGFNIEETRDIKLNTEAGPDTYWSFLCRK